MGRYICHSGGRPAEPYPRREIIDDVMKILAQVKALGTHDKLTFRLYQEMGGKYAAHMFRSDQHKDSENTSQRSANGRLRRFSDAVYAADRRLTPRQPVDGYHWNNDHGPTEKLPCLKCSKEFDSWSRSLNRICENCKRCESYMDEDNDEVQTYKIELHGPGWKAFEGYAHGMEV